MSHLPLDARAILQHLNELGYRNISAEQLREFLKDLRKLIKYEERLACDGPKEDHFSSLHKRGTVSSRAKLDKEPAPAQQLDVPCGCVTQKTKEPAPPKQLDVPCGCVTQKNAASQTQNECSKSIEDMTRAFHAQLFLHSARNADVPCGVVPRARPSRSKTRKPTSSSCCPSTDSSSSHGPAKGKRRRSAKSSRKPENCDCASVEQKKGRSKTPKPRSRSASAATRRSPVCASRQRNKAKNLHTDPVALYQYYQNQWNHFRKQIPGENSHHLLRERIRHKLCEPK